MKILLLGKNGQVGWELQRSLAPLGDVVALDSKSTHLCGDLANLEGLAATVHQVQPQVIVNAAAHTAVDKAESEHALAHTVNALAPGVLAQEAAKLGAWLVHYSTDYVFDGSGTRPWIETDAPAPLNVYGHTKLEGERLIAQYCPKHLIFRTSWVYATRGGNFAKTMLKLAQERETLKVINDQTGAPTGADLLADITAHALRSVLPTANHPAGQLQLAGVYHAVASGSTTWFDYANHVIAQQRRAQGATNLIVKDIQPVPTSAFPTPAQRPHNSRLDTTRLQKAFGLILPDWQQGVDRMLAEIS
jgi:dTDP-4-dehydrorhamnose reductase